MQIVTVYKDPDEPYLTNVVVSTVTRLGAHLNRAQAQHLIGSGQVSVDGSVERDPARVLPTKIFSFRIGQQKMLVDLRDVERL
jgi:ribosomal protein S4